MVNDSPTATDASYNRKNQIQDCLMALMVQKPYDSITVTEICSRVGISRRGFYYYFPDKDACLCSIITRKLQESQIYFAEHLPIHTTRRDTLAKVLEYWMEQKDYFDIIVKNRLTHYWLVMGKEYVMTENVGFPSANDFKDDDIVEGRVGAVIAIMLRWHHCDFAVPTQLIAEKCLKAIGLWEEPT